MAKGYRWSGFAAWLDSFRADAVFGWRQLKSRKVTSGAAILSLALATGACTAAFRLIDALLLRPLPISHPERLYSVAFEGIGADGRVSTYDSCSYPMFRQLRTAIQEQAESVAVSYAERIDLSYGRDEEMEKAYRQYVSGAIFETFGLRPARGRLLSASDDATPGAHPVAILSHDYWTRRFAQDPNMIGRRFRMGDELYQVIGVAEERFTGTETGTVTDVFLPMMMRTPRILTSDSTFWLRTLVVLQPGAAAEPVRERLRATFRSIQQERAKGLTGMSPRRLEQFFQEKLLLDPAASGRSNLQRDYGRTLLALGILVLLVLLIACANVANLMTAQATARAREMALRVSIGAGRWRLLQLVLVECAWIALLATVIGGFFAWWSAPFLVGLIHSPDNPARLVLPGDWRVAAFSLALACGVTFLFGLAPALRASAVQPVHALKGGSDPHARRRMMHALIVLQVSFCFVILFVAALFAASFDKLTRQPTGFSAERILNLQAIALQPQSPAYWDQVADRLRSVPGVEAVAQTVWPLMSGQSAVGTIVVNGAPPSETPADFLKISPGWFSTMRISLIEGRDFSPADTNPPVAIVNQSFAKQFFNGENPTGKWFENEHRRFQIVGFVQDARSRDDLRRPIRPTAYFPLHTVDTAGSFMPMGRGTFVVRTQAANPMNLAPILRQEVSGTGAAIYVSDIRAQVEINLARTVRERLLALLGMFFAVLAMLLAGIGLYGVLDYGVLQRRREIGIRLAIGAQASDIVRRVTGEAMAMVMVGAVAGIVLGVAALRYIETLLYEVKGTGVGMLLIPSLILVTASSLAMLPAVIRAVRIDPVAMLRPD
ncbi:ABC transporter permease [Bryobacter aggregatus]|uniref:ABC transporter permease n=1 Tax=Bryobacter aggregatus TaxID=360054 RepID=UPI0009B5BBBD|nr:ABC transporter permease [Bryobacter aggregatus]